MQTAEEYKEFTISKKPKGKIWVSDREGLGASGYGLCLSAEDMAKIGLLCLNKGFYCGKKIVSSCWIEEMTTPMAVENNRYQGLYYGYLWWIVDQKARIYLALGDSGNVIYVNQEKNVVVAVSSYFKPAVVNRIDFIQEYIEPFLEKK